MKKNIKSTVFQALFLNLGILLMSVGIYFLKTQNNFATGGVSGVSIVLARIPGRNAADDDNNTAVNGNAFISGV